MADYILADNGFLKYKQPEIMKLDISFNNGTGSFILTENMMAYLSSQFMGDELGAVLRGLRLICSWEDSTQEIDFIIRTDIGKSN